MLVVILFVAIILVVLLGKAVSDSRYVHEKEEPPEGPDRSLRVGQHCNLGPEVCLVCKTISSSVIIGLEDTTYAGVHYNGSGSYGQVGASFQRTSSGVQNVRKFGGVRWVHIMPSFLTGQMGQHQAQCDSQITSTGAQCV
jgi:hypothetical protein